MKQERKKKKLFETNAYYFFSFILLFNYLMFIVKLSMKKKKFNKMRFELRTKQKICVMNWAIFG